MSDTVERHAGNIEAVPVGEGRTLRVDGHLVAVFRLRGGGVRATQPWCPHRAGPLADGLVGDDDLVCPLHGRTFALGTGDTSSGEVGVAVYPVRLDDDGTIVLTLPVEGPLPASSDGVPAAAPPGAQAASAPFAKTLAEGDAG